VAYSGTNETSWQKNIWGSSPGVKRMGSAAVIVTSPSRFQRVLKEVYNTQNYWVFGGFCRGQQYTTYTTAIPHCPIQLHDIVFYLLIKHVDNFVCSHSLVELSPP
jgi:hypothetical protein